MCNYNHKFHFKLKTINYICHILKVLYSILGLYYEIMKEIENNSETQETPQIYCGLTFAMTLLSGRWKVNILWMLKNGINRYGKLKLNIKGISEKMLTERLRELESEGLIIRKDFQRIPPHVEYYLSDSGKLLEPILDELNIWGEQVHYNTK